MSVALINPRPPPAAFQHGALFGSALEAALQTAFAAGRHVLFDTKLRAECFLFGALCAKAGLPVPEWLNGAPLWAHGAALKGYDAFMVEGVARVIFMAESVKPSGACR